MKIIIDRDILLKGIKFCNSIIGQNTIYPILKTILVKAEKNKLKLISSNNLSSCEFLINEKINIINDGVFLINSKTLINIISKLEGKEVFIEKVDNSLIKIKSNRFDSNLNILNDEEYPNIKFKYNDWDNISISYKKLLEVSKKILPSVNYNFEKNTVFNGVLFDSESNNGFIEIIGTDSYKMSYIKYNFNSNKMKMIIDPIIIKTILEFSKKDNILFFKKDNKIIITFDNIIISTRNIDGNFPNIEKIINQEYLYKFKVDKNNLINILNRGNSLIINESKPISNFKISKNNILISFKSIEVGFASENIDIESENQISIEFNININYLISLLKSFENNEVTFYILEDNKPILIKDFNDPNFIQVLVPLRKN